MEKEKTVLEVCTDSVESAIAAKKGGADRIELCSNLIIGGTTPDTKMYRIIQNEAGIPARILIRPRFGDFCYSKYEKELILEQIQAFREEGAQGVVIGALLPDGSFDMIISRNLTWTLPHVRHAYREWIRVLKKGGILLNFDANYGITDFSNVEDLPENHAHNMLGDDMMRECEELKRQLPISSYSRPAWDLETLGAMELKEFRVDLGISSRIYLEKDAFYNPTPLFMLRTIK